MYSTIQKVPDQFEESLRILSSFDRHPFFKIKPRFFYLAGMGGSTLPGELVNDYLRGQSFIHIIRDYTLPQNLTPQDVVICASYSGNTEETLKIFNEAMAKSIPVIVLGHGGELEKKAQVSHVPFIEIPESVQPRCAIGNFFTSILWILEKFNCISPQKEILLRLAKFLKERQEEHDLFGKQFARKLVDKIPIIYGPDNFLGVCRIWKIKFNENCKIQSYFNVYPEMNHNEMEGYGKIFMNLCVIQLYSHFMGPQITKRMDVFASLFANKFDVHRVELSGSNQLEEVFDALAIADYTTYYLSQIYQVNPNKVPIVEEFKKQLMRP